MEIINGNIFLSDCDAICNPVNTIGVGAGLALGFKETYPAMFEIYKHLCRENLLSVGFPCILFKRDKFDRDIILFPTKKHWKNPSQLIWIEDGLDYLNKIIDKNQIKSIGFPLLGCGLGGLKKEDVLLLIEKFENQSGIVCKVYGE